jgi:DNA-binding NarL/FixJ family response regulator
VPTIPEAGVREGRTPGHAVYDRTHFEAAATPTLTGPRHVRVLLVAQPDLVTESLRRALDREAGFTVVRTIEHSADLAAEAAALAPDVVLVAEATHTTADLAPLVDGGGGLQPPVVLLGTHPSGRNLAAALTAGYAGLVTWDVPFADLVATLRVVAGGGTRIPRALLPELTAALHGRRAPTELSTRELEVLALMAEGLSTEELMTRLTLSIHTVRNHIRRVMAKLGAHSRLEAVVLAHRRGLIAGATARRIA